MVGQGLEVVALFDSDDEGRAQEARLRDEMASSFQRHAFIAGDAAPDCDR